MESYVRERLFSPYAKRIPDTSIEAKTRDVNANQASMGRDRRQVVGCAAINKEILDNDNPLEWQMRLVRTVVVNLTDPSPSPPPLPTHSGLCWSLRVIWSVLEVFARDF